MPAAQVVLDPGDGGDIDRVAGEYPVAHRESVPGDGHADDDLRCVTATVLAVAALPRGGMGLLAGHLTAPDVAVLVALIFLVALEVQRGGVVEDHLDVQVEQIGDAVEDGLFDHVLARFQKVHGAVQLVQFQPCVPSMCASSLSHCSWQ